MMILTPLQLLSMLDSKCSQYSIGESEARYVGSLTKSGMLILAVDQLKQMGVFSYHLVLLQTDDHQIYCYQSEQDQNSYLMMVPLEFSRSSKHKTSVFVQLLCLSSMSVTVPLEGVLLGQVLGLLGELRIRGEVVRGRKVAKIELETDCMVSYLDMVSFQGVQFQENSNEQILLMKKSNAYEYSINCFKEQALPTFFGNPDDSIENLIQRELASIRVLYHSLAVTNRFKFIYQLKDDPAFSIGQLQKQIEEMIVGRQVTTVPDEEYDELIDGQIARLIEAEIAKNTHPEISVKELMKNVVQKLKRYEFELTEEKYFFITECAIQKLSALQERQKQQLRAENQSLRGKIRDIEAQLQAQTKQYSQVTLSSKENTAKKMGKNQRDCQECAEFFLQDSPNGTKKMTLSDVKQPLRVLNTNGLQRKDKLSKGLLREPVKQRMKEGFLWGGGKM